MVFPGSTPTTKMTYRTHYKAYKAMHVRVGIRSSKVTHCHRPSAATELQQKGADDGDIATLAMWKKDVQHDHYQKLHKPEAIAKAAGFRGQEAYFLWRGELNPGQYFPKMWSSVFPEVEAQLEAMKTVYFNQTWFFEIL